VLFFGAQPSRFPKNYADFEVYMKWMLSPENPILQVDPVGRQLASFLFQSSTLKSLPWIALPLANLSAQFAFHMLPPHLVESFQIPKPFFYRWHTILVAYVRFTVPLLPSILRYIPSYLMAMERIKFVEQHPQSTKKYKESYLLRKLNHLYVGED